MSISPEERRHRARTAAYARWAAEDPVDGTRKAREAQWAAFERQADPDGTLPPQERQRRATALWRAHLSRMALKSAQARRRRAEDRA